MKSIVFILFLFPNILVLAQKTEHNTNWKLLKSENGIEIYYKYIECHLQREYPQEKLLLKFNNTTGTSAFIKWQNLLWYNGKCQTCNKEIEYSYQIELAPHSNIEGKCNNNNGLSIFSKFIKRNNSSVLTKFDVKIITIKNETK